jgi:hypothetical protein
VHVVGLIWFLAPLEICQDGAAAKNASQFKGKCAVVWAQRAKSAPE